MNTGGQIVMLRTLSFFHRCSRISNMIEKFLPAMWMHSLFVSRTILLSSSILWWLSQKVILKKLSAWLINPYWQIMENSSRNFSEIFIFRVVTQAVLLENSSKRTHLVENNISRILGCHPDRFSGKLIQTKCYTSYRVSVKKSKKSFSSKKACVTTRKMKISEKFLDEFSLICQEILS